MLAWLCAATPARAYIYWTQGQGNGAPIVRANLAGTGVRHKFITHAGSFGIALDAGHIYLTGDYTYPGTIGRENLDGTGLDRAFIGAGASTGALAVDGAHIYWSGPDAIARADLDGSAVNPHLLPASTPDGIAVDSAHIYRTNFRRRIGLPGDDRACEARRYRR